MIAQNYFNVRMKKEKGYGSLEGSRTELAQQAFLGRQKEFSKLIHDQKVAEGHRVNGDFLKSIVYGGLDGILTIFAIITGAAGGSLGFETVLVLGWSNLLANAISMGIGDVVSTLAYHEHVLQERARECWELENYPEGEIEEMVDLYESKGLERSKAAEVIEIMARYKDLFLDTMVSQELGLVVPKEDEDPYKEGFVTFLSFLVFGGVPLMGYVLAPWLFDITEDDESFLFRLSCLLTMIVLFLLGCCKSFFCSSRWWYSGTEFVLLGGATALVSYGVANAVSLLGKDVFDVTV
eukprot:maker-scaffold_4-snap-gene-5.68-mRNA-1 protein AED:0.22 eAED:0.22 QI:60/1/1/1/1/1/2/737/293